MGFILFPKEAGRCSWCISLPARRYLLMSKALVSHISLLKVSSGYMGPQTYLDNSPLRTKEGRTSSPSGATLGESCRHCYSGMDLFFGAAHWVSHNHTRSSELHFSLCLFLGTHTTSSLIVSYLQITTPTLYIVHTLNSEHFLFLKLLSPPQK